MFSRSTRRTRMPKTLIAAAGVLTCVAAAAPAAALHSPAAVRASTRPAPATSSARTPSYPVVASGLDNPRQLAFAPNGDLFVAESGHGGHGPCIPSDDNPDVNTCYGTTGAVTRIRGGHQKQILTGLPSLAAQVATQGGQLPPGAQAAGPSGITILNGHEMALTIGLGSNPSNRMEFSAASSVGHLLGTVVTSKLSHRWWYFWRRHGHNDWQLRGDLAAFEALHNPVPPDTPDSNPNAVIRDGRDLIVADAGGNDLLRVHRNGRVGLIAKFPAATPGGPTHPQAVPTAVVRGPDGAYYVSELTGFPFPQGGAVIWKVKHGHVSVYATGLTNVTDLAFGRHGDLYAVEIAQGGLTSGPIGAVVRIPRGGGDHFDVIAQGLFAPYGIALRHGCAYVTVGSILPATANGGGKVLRIPLH